MTTPTRRIAALKVRLLQIERRIMAGEPALTSAAERGAIYAELEQWKGGES